MSKGNYLVVYEKQGRHHKICRIIFGSDGSYYVTSPYHPANKAVIMKLTVKYGEFEEETQIPFEEALDMASLDDDEKRLKLTHHPSGFIQFSGEGIISGKDEHGNPKGVGVQSWPLTQPVAGPSFGITLLGLEHFQQVDKIKDDFCIFKEDELVINPTSNGYTLEGFYLPVTMRRFIERALDGTKMLNLVHPSGSVIRLKVLLPPEKNPLQGFIGLTLYPSSVMVGENSDASSAYMLSSSTGNLRIDEQGNRIADGLYCIYPRSSGIIAKRDLKYNSAEGRTQ